MNQQFLVTALTLAQTGAQPSGNVVPALVRSAQFDGDVGSYLSNPNPLTLQITSSDSYILGGWIKVSGAGTLEFFSKVNNGGTELIYIRLGSDMYITFTAQVATATEDSIKQTGTALVIGQKAFVVCVNDRTNKLLTIYINGTQAGQFDYTTDAGTFSGSGGSCYFGGGNISTGSVITIDEFFFCKNPADLVAAVSLINTTVYNSGSGKLFAGLTAGNKTTMGLSSWWTFDEASGTRADSKGILTLSVSGNVVAAAPLVG